MHPKLPRTLENEGLKHPRRATWGPQPGQQPGETVPGPQEGALLGACRLVLKKSMQPEGGMPVAIF